MYYTKCIKDLNRKTVKKLYRVNYKKPQKPLITLGVRKGIIKHRVAMQYVFPENLKGQNKLPLVIELFLSYFVFLHFFSMFWEVESPYQIVGSLIGQCITNSNSFSCQTSTAIKN